MLGNNHTVGVPDEVVYTPGGGVTVPSVDGLSMRRLLPSLPMLVYGCRSWTGIATRQDPAPGAKVAAESVIRVYFNHRL